MLLAEQRIIQGQINALEWNVINIFVFILI